MTIYDHWLYRFLTGPLNNVAWLYILLPCVFAGGIYLTVGSGAVQFRRFGYAMKNTAGKLFKKQETAHGAITPLQAVTTALAATVGTGNIVGTSQAIAMGGYGAVFWLWMAALLGMVIKYSEVLLAVKYRERDARGDWVGGPMYYIKNGMGEKWKWLAGAFSVLAALAAFGIGNMSQANSIVGSVTDAVCAVNPDFSGQAALRWGLGIGLALLTALVLFGGIKRIGAVTEKLIPFMSVAYILMTLIVIFGNLGGVGRAFKAIFSAPFSAARRASRSVRRSSGDCAGALSPTRPVSAPRRSRTPPRIATARSSRAFTAFSRCSWTPSLSVRSPRSRSSSAAWM